MMRTMRMRTKNTMPIIFCKHDLLMAPLLVIGRLCLLIGLVFFNRSFHFLSLAKVSYLVPYANVLCFGVIYSRCDHIHILARRFNITIRSVLRDGNGVIPVDILLHYA